MLLSSLISLHLVNWAESLAWIQSSLVLLYWLVYFFWRTPRALLPGYLDHKQPLCVPRLYMVLGIRTLVLRLVRQALNITELAESWTFTHTLGHKRVLMSTTGRPWPWCPHLGSWILLAFRIPHIETHSLTWLSHGPGTCAHQQCSAWLLSWLLGLPLH